MSYYSYDVIDNGSHHQTYIPSVWLTYLTGPEKTSLTYLHKIHLFILWYLRISFSVCAIQSLEVLLNSLGISVYMMKFVLKYIIRKKNN